MNESGQILTQVTVEQPNGGGQLNFTYRGNAGIAARCRSTRRLPELRRRSSGQVATTRHRGEETSPENYSDALRQVARSHLNSRR